LTVRIRRLPGRTLRSWVVQVIYVRRTRPREFWAGTEVVLHDARRVIGEEIEVPLLVRRRFEERLDGLKRCSSLGARAGESSGMGRGADGSEFVLVNAFKTELHVAADKGLLLQG